MTIFQLKHSTHMSKPLVLYKCSPLLPFMGGELITYAFVAKHLQKIISFNALNRTLYKGHSFRIGTATQLDYYENCIQKLGRWKSDIIHSVFKP